MAFPKNLPVKKFQFPESADPFGKASACLREAASAKAGAGPLNAERTPCALADGFTKGKIWIHYPSCQPDSAV